MPTLKKNDELIAFVQLDNLTHWLEENNLSKADVVIEYSETEQKTTMRQKIQASVADIPSLLGTTADASIVTIDNLVFDVLAVDRSASSSYKTQRITIYEEVHGSGSWKSAVAYATQWLEGRKSGAIKSPVDIKGAANVFAEVAQRATGVAQVFEETNQA